MHPHRCLSSLLLLVFVVGLFAASPRYVAAQGASGGGQVVQTNPAEDIDAVVGAPVGEGPPPTPAKPAWADTLLGRVLIAVGFLVFLASLVRFGLARRGARN